MYRGLVVGALIVAAFCQLLALGATLLLLDWQLPLEFFLTLALVGSWNASLILMLIRVCNEPNLAAQRQMGTAINRSLGGWLCLIGALAWLSISILVGSHPTSTPFNEGASFLFLTSLIIFWLTVLIARAYEGARARSISVRSIFALISVPASLVVVLVLVHYAVPLRVRLDLSEAALLREMREIETSDADYSYVGRRVGLYDVRETFVRDECVFFDTRLMGNVGLAHCRRQPATPTGWSIEHVQGPWWTYTFPGS